MLVARVCFAIAPSARHSVSLRASLAPNRHRRARSTSPSSQPSTSHGSSPTWCPSLSPLRLVPQRGPKVQRPCDHRTAAREHGPGFDARWEETWVPTIVVEPINRFGGRERCSISSGTRSLRRCGARWHGREREGRRERKGWIGMGSRSIGFRFSDGCSMFRIFVFGGFGEKSWEILVERFRWFIVWGEGEFEFLEWINWSGFLD